MNGEYKVVPYKRKPRFLFKLDEQALEDKINSMGTDGWEVISLSIQMNIFGREESALVLFRRDKNLK